MTDQNKKNGLFITLEGGEGAGKSTQTALLSDYLSAKEIPHIVTREPGGTKMAEMVRQLLFDDSYQVDDIIVELLLILAARRQHLLKVIIPALKSQKTVICDRYFDSTKVYQGLVGGLGLSKIEELNRLIFSDLEDYYTPDVTLYLDIGVAESSERLGTRAQANNRYDSASTDFHTAVRSGFLKLCKAEPHRIVAINAHDDVDNIHELIISHLLKHL